MNFELNNEQLMVREVSATFAEKEVKPLVHDIDGEERFPAGTVERMKRYGFFGISYPKELGGQGCNVLTYIMRVEELSKVCGTTGAIVSAHTFLCADPIYKYGTKERKEEYLVPLAFGKKIDVSGLTEPGAGTDASDRQTKIVLNGNHYVLSGSKILIINGGVTDIYIMFAIIDRSKGVKDIFAFIVEEEFPGFSIGKKERKMGIHGSATAEPVFGNCIVLKENLLGQEGKGFFVAMTTLDGGRIGIAARALGITEGVSGETIKYAKERKQFGRPITALQSIQFRIVNMKTKIDATQLLVYRATILKQADAKFFTETAMVRLSATEAAIMVIIECVRLFGGYGYTREYPVERMMRDTKITEAYEGTGEVQYMVISNVLLKQGGTRSEYRCKYQAGSGYQ